MAETSAGSETTKTMRTLIEFAALGIELLEVAVIVAAILPYANGTLALAPQCSGWVRAQQAATQKDCYYYPSRFFIQPPGWIL
ncbi:MAG TPA: hypothetical protein VHP35_18280 [Terriglobia bacterium]|nr:hypothetical protein [Terriglobia bacterium]